MPRWIIAGALQQEVKGLHALMDEKVTLPVPRGMVWSGYLEQVPVLLARTGIGGKKARGVCEYLLKSFSCRGIISIGYAGSLTRGTNVGDVLVANEVVLVTPPEAKVFHTDKELLSLARESIGEESRGVAISRMITINRVIVSAEEKQKLGAQFNASAVEMESGFLAELAKEERLPFLAIRTISDGVFTDLPDFNKIVVLKVKKKYLTLLSYSAMHPQDFLGLLRMQRCAIIASHTLTHSVREFFRKLG